MSILFSVPSEHELKSASSVLHHTLRNLVTDIQKDRAFLGVVFFWTLAAACFARDVFDNMPQAIVRDFVEKCWRGNGFLPAPVSTHGVELLVSRERPPSMYSTFYGSQILEMLASPIGAKRWKAVAEYVLAQQQPSGWFYDPKWADTALPLKMESELFYETYFGVLLLKEANLVSNVRAKVSDAVRSHLREGVRCVSSLYFGIATLLELGELGEEECHIVSGFLGRHISASGVGVHDYLMETVKVDEVAGQVQRYQFDQFEPSMVASYRALELVSRLRVRGYKSEVIQEVARAACRFLRTKTAVEDAGTPIRIAAYDRALGPVTSATELIMWLCKDALMKTVGET